MTREPYAVHAEAVDGVAEITDLSDVDATPDLSQAHNVEVYATVIRADGTKEDVGIIAAGYKSGRRSILWKFFGKRASTRRIKAINQRHAERG